MANFQTHLTTSTILGLGYGVAGALGWSFDWGHAALAAALTALGGVLPDLDSDSGIPVRELFSLAGVVVPLMLLRRLFGLGFSVEEVLVVCGAVYLLVRYGVSYVFKHLTVHRGMFHSIPAMLLAGLVVYHVHGEEDGFARQYLACGVMLGFLSHLVLDELYAVDFMGHTIKLNKFAGSALKLFSPSWMATGLTYSLLALAGSSYLRAPAATAPLAPPMAPTLATSPPPNLVPPPPPWTPIPNAAKQESPVHQVIRPSGPTKAKPTSR